jgi:hypothetical protein
MDLLDLLKLMFRRWYVTAPVIALTLGTALAIGAQIRPEYRTTVAVLLVPPTVTDAAPAPDSSPQQGNPWLRIGHNAMAQAVQIAASTHDARTRVAAAGGDPGYEIGVVPRSSILTVDIAAGTPDRATTTVAAVTRLLTDEVAHQQAQYRPAAGEQITTRVLDPGHEITPSRSNVLRLQIVVLSIGLLVAAGSAVLYDAVARRRTSDLRRPAGRQPAEPAPDVDRVETAPEAGRGEVDPGYATTGARR